MVTVVSVQRWLLLVALLGRGVRRGVGLVGGVMTVRVGLWNASSCSAVRRASSAKSLGENQS